MTSRASQAVFGVWIPASSTRLGSTKYKLERNGDVIRGRFDAHGRVINEAVVQTIRPNDHAKFEAIVNQFKELKVESPRRMRIGATSRRRTSVRTSIRSSLRRSLRRSRSKSPTGGRFTSAQDAALRAKRLRTLDAASTQTYVPPDMRFYGIVVGGKP
jgi:hypothetical protein